jgi:pSer/pThr/pTyr-binding forkhead associated (FHA) protein
VARSGDKRGSVIPAGVSANLTVVDGPDRGRTQKIQTRRVLIGRKTGDLVLRDSKVSSTHAAIEYLQGKFVLFDLGSTNGTFINDKRITQRSLKDNDEVRIGFSTLLFRVSSKKKQSNPLDSLELSVDSDEEEISKTDISLVSEKVDKPVKKEEPVSAEDVEVRQLVLWFKMVEGPYRGHGFKSKKESIVIGRVNTDVNLKDDKDVSRKHAVIEVMTGEQIFIRDLASTNGTFVNGKRISNCRLQKGDEIKVGNSTMQLRIDLES